MHLEGEAVMKQITFLWLVLIANALAAQHSVSYLHVKDAATSKVNTSANAIYSTPFELTGGIIIVQASLQGISGDFILDTGAPGIVLNSHAANTVKSLKGRGISGNVNIGAIELSDFEWGIIHEPWVNGYMLDVSHLEKACGRAILGLIGFDVLRDYEVVFDFRAMQISILPGKITAKSVLGEPTFQVPFTMYGHLPVLKAKIGGRTAFLGIDSGAEVNLLDQSYFDKLRIGQITDVEQEFLAGLSASQIPVLAADVLDTKLQDLTVQHMRYFFTDMSFVAEQLNADLDGLLGFPFFKNRIISINYRKQQVFVWE